jgi:hypothetical protein
VLDIECFLIVGAGDAVCSSWMALMQRAMIEAGHLLIERVSD